MKIKENDTTYQMGDQVLVYAGEETFFGKSREMLAEVLAVDSYNGRVRVLVEIIDPREAAGYKSGDRIRFRASALTKL